MVPGDAVSPQNFYHSFTGASTVQTGDTFLFIGGMKEVDAIPQCTPEIFEYDPNGWIERNEVLAGEGRGNMAVVVLEEDQLPESCRGQRKKK